MPFGKNDTYALKKPQTQRKILSNEIISSWEKIQDYWNGCNSSDALQDKLFDCPSLEEEIVVVVCLQQSKLSSHSQQEIFVSHYPCY